MNPFPTGQGAQMIALERLRQTEAEGWTPEHDDEHDAGEMARAAACYAHPNPETTGRFVEGLSAIVLVPADWPWERRWWKPTPADRVRQLVKAGALIAAEIDRLERQKDARRV